MRIVNPGMSEKSVCQKNRDHTAFFVVPIFCLVVRPVANVVMCGLSR